MRTHNIQRGNKIIIMNERHSVYFYDIESQFDYFFEAIYPIKDGEDLIADYSLPRWHDIKGYDLHPILFPSIPEPIITSKEYLDFSQLKQGDTVLDLGAYCGLSSILFKNAVGQSGRVIALEADSNNYIATNRNLSIFNRLTGLSVELIYGAAWNHHNGIQFSSESCMGSSAISIVGDKRGLVESIPSFTLSYLLEKISLNKVDFIKVDIEGAESVIFEDKIFFDKFRPNIIVEVHNVPACGPSSANKVMADLSSYGYKFQITGSLIKCSS